jgi:hypothetical protein
MDSRCDGYYFIYTIGYFFPNLIRLDLVDEKNFASTQKVKRECLVETFAHFDKLRTLNITGNFDLGLHMTIFGLNATTFSVHTRTFGLHIVC